jgi:hypothetical protein
MWPLALVILGIYAVKKWHDAKTAPTSPTTGVPDGMAPSPDAGAPGAPPGPQDQGSGGSGGGGGGYSGGYDMGAPPGDVATKFAPAAIAKPATPAVRRVTTKTAPDSGLFTQGVAARAASSPTAGLLGAVPTVDAPLPRAISPTQVAVQPNPLFTEGLAARVASSPTGGLLGATSSAPAPSAPSVPAPTGTFSVVKGLRR